MKTLRTNRLDQVGVAPFTLAGTTCLAVVLMLSACHSPHAMRAPASTSRQSIDPSQSTAGITALRADDPGVDPDFERDLESDPHNTETYDYIVENPFLDPIHEPLSTFAADVDTASYSNVRRLLNSGIWPPAGAVHIEEMVNYFTYDYAIPADRNRPFHAKIEVTDCPWNVGHRIAAIGIKAWDVELEERPPANLIFLIDVSGSMVQNNKLPLLQRSLSLLVHDLRSDDHIGIVAYSNRARVILDPTPGSERERIIQAIESLYADGSTNGGSGLELAYDMAARNFIEGGVNRVILATDGDFNIGTTSESALVRLITRKAKTGTDLSVLGFGTGNYKDSTLEKIADFGNGNYFYIDGIREARRVLIERMGSTLITVAKDVKLQVEFNPTEVSAYRLIGYENRLMAAHEFLDDEKDAGEIGAGHEVTALYEIIPSGAENGVAQTPGLKYQSERQIEESAAKSGELFTLRIRYKDPADHSVDEIEIAAHDNDHVIDECTDSLRFATAVAEFGLVLRKSKYLHHASLDQVIALAQSCTSNDEREEFVNLVRTAQRVRGSTTTVRRSNEEFAAN